MTRTEREGKGSTEHSALLFFLRPLSFLMYRTKQRRMMMILKDLKKLCVMIRLLCDDSNGFGKYIL